MTSIRIYLLAGILTVPGYFRPLKEALQLRYEAAGMGEVSFKECFPYGTFKVGMVKQLMEVQHDIRLSPSKSARSIGGRRVAEDVLKDEGIGKRIFIGHSAGGIAASQAFDILWRQQRLEIERSVLIGSPKVRMSPHVSERSLYIVQRKRWRKDWFSYFGIWDKHLPSERIEVSTLGRHADYFRDYEPYLSEQGSNLELTVNEIWRCLTK